MHICLTVYPQVKCLNEMLESRMAQSLDFFFFDFRTLARYNEISWGWDLTLSVKFVYISYIPSQIA